MTNITDAYKAMGPPPTSFSGKEALGELLANTSVYAESRTDVRPYAKHLVAWPSVAARSVDLGDCLGEADRAWLRDWRLHMLRPTDESAALIRDSAVRRPYADPSLVHRPQVYADFLHTLHDRHMLRWTLAAGREETLAPFFVGKKATATRGERQRIIFDTRVANLYFATRLPLALLRLVPSAAWSPLAGRSCSGARLIWSVAFTTCTSRTSLGTFSGCLRFERDGWGLARSTALRSLGTPSSCHALPCSQWGGAGRSIFASS